MQYFSAIRIGLFLSIAFVFQGLALAQSEYPAAYFEPYIIYQAPEIGGKAPAAAASEPAGGNSYPAAYFEPVIVYQDKDLIAAQEKQQATEPEPAPAQKPEASTKKNNPVPVEPAPAPVSEKEGFPLGVLLLIAAIAGGLYWVISRNQSGTGVEASSAGTEVAGSDEGSAGDSGQPGAQAAERPEAS